MDFHIVAPAGSPVNDPATMVARGADPLITIPAGTTHLFRRITGLVLQPVPGALLPTPELCPLSQVEVVLGAALSVEGQQTERTRMLLTRCVLPSKFEAVLVQLELEPPGVGLDPQAIYDDLDHAAHAVLVAVSRVAARPGPLPPAYVLGPGDSFDVEPIAAGAPAAFHALAAVPTGIMFGHLEGIRGFLVHFGLMAFVCYGKSLSNSRDQNGQPSRRVLAAIQPLAVAAAVASAAPAGTFVSAEGLSQWLQLTEPGEHLAFCIRGPWWSEWLESSGQLLALTWLPWTWRCVLSCSWCMHSQGAR